MRQSSLGLVVALCFCSPVFADVTYDLPSNSEIGPGRIFGQTFTVPTDATVLDRFTVRVRSDAANTLFDFRVSAWNGTTATVMGPVLYASSPQAAQPTADFTNFTFNLNLPLVAGGKYIGFIDNADDAYWRTGTLRVAGNYLNAYPAGAFAFPSSGQIDGSWIVYTNGQDLSFGARFVAVPLPPAAWMGLSLLGGLSAWRRLLRK